MRAKKFLTPTVRFAPIRWVIYYEILFTLLLMCGAAAFFLRRSWQAWRLRLVMIGIMLFFIGISFACGYARLRFAYEPLLIIAAVGARPLQDFVAKLSRWFRLR